MIASSQQAAIDYQEKQESCACAKGHVREP
jgi:hypothetical protein